MTRPFIRGKTYTAVQYKYKRAASCEDIVACSVRGPSHGRSDLRRNLIPSLAFGHLSGVAASSDVVASLELGPGSDLPSLRRILENLKHCLLRRSRSRGDRK
ncbi:hypothetical protein CBR_g17718 [Chara braunii]|uniref:Uncharacterized protein n=1 Tax=Chara braunii TaxID=69332 RepID=A0A388KVI2_CHABU|nr:hypothetical protein CBR_g17718 [Chara braunii]|eukprot:GBG74008.1 hypothetical protein CBR_g17718 [Chara braunii]